MALAPTAPDLSYRVLLMRFAHLQRLLVRIDISLSLRFLPTLTAVALPRLTGKISRTAPSQSHTEAGTVRKRAQRACSQCHSHKTKCSGDLPKCQRCEVGDLACEYTPAKRNFASVPSNSTTSKCDGNVTSNQGSESFDIGSPVIKNNGGHFLLSIDVSILNAEYVSLSIFSHTTNRWLGKCYSARTSL